MRLAKGVQTLSGNKEVRHGNGARGWDFKGEKKSDIEGGRGADIEGATKCETSRRELGGR